jgi:seryl-tRNA synthetase
MLLLVKRIRRISRLKFVERFLKFNFKPLDHVQLGEKLDLIEFERATKVAGSKFYYLKK